MTCFAARLKQLRNQRGLTQTEVAAAIGVTRSVVSLYENEMPAKSGNHYCTGSALRRYNGLPVMRKSPLLCGRFGVK